MVGHGSPPANPALGAVSSRRSQRARRWTCLAVRAAFLLLALAPLAFPQHALAQQATLRLRIAWGEGVPQTWRGTIRVEQGQLSSLRRLGPEDDLPDSTRFEQGAVRVEQIAPTAFDGFDVRFTGPLDTNLIVELTAAETAGLTQRVVLPLTRLTDRIDDAFHSAALDNQRNRVLIRRTPGDRLRVQFARDALIFSPAEMFELTILPYHLGIPAGTDVDIEMTVVRARTGRPTNWAGLTETHTVDREGSTPTIGPVRIELPREEGVYDVLISLKERGLAGRKTLVAERKIQLVVVGDQRIASGDAPWAVFDPSTNKSLFNRLGERIPKPFRRGAEAPIDDGNVETIAGTQDVRLAPRSWRATILDVKPGVPNIIEVAYPTDRVQTLGISVLEPNRAGFIVPLGVDSGVDVPHAQPEGSRETHRLIVWPRTSQPVLLMHNLRPELPAVFGRIRVLTGPAALPSATGDVAASGRLLTAWYNKPLFSENFSADEGLDDWTNQSLDDWTTFYQGATRLAQYLKHAGFNSAGLVVATDGASIYPSRLFQGTRKFDTGAFFVTGQDAVQKDVLELLFRVFDREGLKLIPAIEFTGPIDPLEDLLHAGDATGVRLVDDRRRLRVPGRDLVPRYNILDSRVQTVVMQAVAELVDRYQHHRSFAGVALPTGAASYINLPGDQWGYDAATLSAFERATKDGADPSTREGRQQFVAWRAKTLARFHRRLEDEVTRRRSDAKLMFPTSGVVDSQPLRDALRPRLPDVHKIDGAMAQVGLAADVQSPTLAVARPYLVSPLLSVARQGAELTLNLSTDVDEFFESGRGATSQFFFPPLRTTLPSFDAKSPFGADKTHTFLAAHVSPGGIYARRAFVRDIARRDPTHILYGGWMVPLGQESALTEVMSTFSQLPPQPFETVQSNDNDKDAEPVVVRSFRDRNSTWVYLVNDTAWPVNVAVQLRMPPGCRPTVLGSRPPAFPASGPWQLAMRPYDLVAVHFNSGSVRVAGWQSRFDEQIAVNLQQRIHDLQGRIVKVLPQPQPVSVLANPDFEKGFGWNFKGSTPAPVSVLDGPNPEHAGGNVFGWEFARKRGLQIGIDQTDVHGGKGALSVRSDGPVAWVRSDPFDPPETGRLSLWAWIKASNAARQAPVRLAIEGKLNGETYYHFALVNFQDAEDRGKWQPFVVSFDTLPLAGLKDLKIGFDMMGPGDILIDDVQIFDTWFVEAERNALLKGSAVARHNLRENRLRNCEQFLDGYWSRFLQEYVRPPDPIPRQAARTGTAAGQSRPANPPAEQKGVWDQMKNFVPKKIFFWR